MSESDSTSPAESFELINEANNDQKNTLISPSLSSASTDSNIEDLNEEFRMEFKEKLDEISNVAKIAENQLIEKPAPSQMVNNLLENVEPSSGDKVDEDFDNRKLQEQLNMQIQLNQQHLQQRSQKLEQPPPQQLNSQHFNDIHQMQQLYPTYQSQQPNQTQSPLSSQSQVQFNQQTNQQHTESNPVVDQVSNTSNVTSNEVAKLAPPIAPSNFDPSAFLGWFTKQDFLNKTINKVTENAMNGFNSVLITLDPQMKEIRLAGGPSILVTSNHTFDIESVRDGFLDVFKRATVKSIDTFLSIETAIQLVGYSTAHKISLERIKGLRSNISIVAQNQIIVSIENFLYNFDDRWFDSDYFLLDDPLNKIQLSVHTQGTPIEQKYVEQLKSKANHKFRDDGFSVRLDSLIASDLNCSIGESFRCLFGFDKSKLHYQAVLLLSNLYKNQLKAIGRLNE